MSAANGTISGSYDHSQEYDPYQSAARQMQELLFGTSFLNSSGSGGKASLADNKTAEADSKGGGVSTGGGGGGGGSSSPPSLKPSTNSAFQKYVPANVPSTAEITSRLSGGGGGTSGQSRRLYFLAPSSCCSHKFKGIRGIMTSSCCVIIFGGKS